MIPNNTHGTVLDELPAIAEAEFTIDAEDAKWMMQLAADAYSDVSTAVAREYFTNGWDATVEAGRTRPVEVTLPSAFNRFYRVRDFGTGMSMEKMLKVYTKFGKSTGRETNEKTGMLGIGSKSAVAYTTQFTVVSIHEGMRTEAIISRDNDWNIVLKVVSHRRSVEDEGTEIVVPVHNPDEFAHKAMDYFRFVLPGRVLVNGQPPVHNVGEKISDNLYYSNQWHQSYVVMGNVPYRINNPDALFYNVKMSRINFVAYVENGDVDFSNSREDLKYTEKTKATLQQIIVDFQDQIIEEAKAEIDKAGDAWEAYAAWSKWSGMLGKSMFADLEYDGKKFEDTINLTGTCFNDTQYRYNTNQVWEWYVSKMKDTLIITGFHTKVASHHKAKVRDYAAHVGIAYKHFLFVSSSKVENDWVDPKRVISWEDLKAAVPKKARKPASPYAGPRRVPGSWDYWTVNGFSEEKEIPAGSDLYYMLVNEAKRWGENTRDILNSLKWTNAVVIRMPKNRMDKFLRENPKAKRFITEARKHVVIDGGSLVPAEAKKALAVSHETRSWLQTLDTNEINDPRWTATKVLIERQDAQLKPYNDNKRLATLLGMGYDVKDHGITRSDNWLLRDYPLLSEFSFYRVRNKKHLYIYMNAVYAAKKGSN